MKKDNEITEKLKPQLELPQMIYNICQKEKTWIFFFAKGNFRIYFRKSSGKGQVLKANRIQNEEVSFKEMALLFIEKKGYKPIECQSEDQARLDALKLIKEGYFGSKE